MSERDHFHPFVPPWPPADGFTLPDGVALSHGLALSDGVAFEALATPDIPAVAAAPPAERGRPLADEVAEFLRRQPARSDPVRRGGGGRPSSSRVLLPYSGSEAADRALEAMIDLAPTFVGQVRVLHVNEYYLWGPGRIYSRSRAEALELVAGAVGRLRGRGIEAVGIVRHAERTLVTRAILAEAVESRASVIMLGVRRRRVPFELLVRGVARQVLRTSPCPVLLVRADPAPKVSPPCSAPGSPLDSPPGSPLDSPPGPRPGSPPGPRPGSPPGPSGDQDDRHRPAA